MWIGFVVNPFHWEVRFTTIQPDDLNPKAHGFYLSLGPFWARVVIDDGEW
jgi:hypothetical protein